MMRCTAAVMLLPLVTLPPSPSGAHRPPPASGVPVRVIGGTTVLGESDPRLWRDVLDLLPDRPAVIVIVDLDRLSPTARARLHGLEAFALSGRPAVYVIRQGAVLRQAEFGGAVDRLLLASVIWHEMGHLEGLDERAAVEREQRLWRDYVAAGRIDSAQGLSIAAELGKTRHGDTKAPLRAAAPASSGSSVHP